MYTSSTDIIRNGIAASSQQMKTCATGLYQVADFANIKNQKKLAHCLLISEIYPEEQKTMIVDTSLYGKGVPIIGTIGNFFMARASLITCSTKKVSVVSHENLLENDRIGIEGFYEGCGLLFSETDDLVVSFLKNKSLKSFIEQFD